MCVRLFTQHFEFISNQLNGRLRTKPPRELTWIVAVSDISKDRGLPTGQRPALLGRLAP